jgi:N-acetylglucosaminyl-diphospho-decaprenol L-rhamnosyltransferase
MGKSINWRLSLKLLQLLDEGSFFLQMKLKTPTISISIVSHGQTELVHRLLKNLVQHTSNIDFEILLTENLPSKKTVADEHQDLQIRTITNPTPKGLAANHNQAFHCARGEYFCMLNPDVLFVENVFPQLTSDIQAGLGEIVAPLVVNHTGKIQDSFRTLPTPIELLKRFIQSNNKQIRPSENDLVYPDWIAGIFLCMRRSTFEQLGGMDERYYLYFEDVDFCCRARLANKRPLLDTKVRLIHEASRLSRKDFRYFLHHVHSAGLFFLSRTYWSVRKLR